MDADQHRSGGDDGRFPSAADQIMLPITRHRRLMNHRERDSLVPTRTRKLRANNSILLNGGILSAAKIADARPANSFRQVGQASAPARAVVSQTRAPAAILSA